MSEELLLAEMNRLKAIALRPGSTKEVRIQFLNSIHDVLIARENEVLAPVLGSALNCPAIVACATACNAAYYKALGNKLSKEEARSKGRIEWITKLPTLTELDSIRSYVTCIAYGIGTDILTPSFGARLLYVAQVAHQTLLWQQAIEFNERKARRRGPYKKRAKYVSEPTTIDPESPEPSDQ